jgi:hypothetical protein
MNSSAQPARRGAEPDIAPHQLASELTRDASVQARDALPQTTPAHPQTAGEVERGIGRTLTLVVLAAIVIGSILAAIVFDKVGLVAIGAVFVIPFLLLVSAPVWLASATKQAQDQTVREQRGSAGSS